MFLPGIICETFLYGGTQSYLFLSLVNSSGFAVSVSALVFFNKPIISLVPPYEVEDL